MRLSHGDRERRSRLLRSYMSRMPAQIGRTDKGRLVDLYEQTVARVAACFDSIVERTAGTKISSRIPHQNQGILGFF